MEAKVKVDQDLLDELHRLHCEILRLQRFEQENQTLRKAIERAIEIANGRESEWGERAEQAFGILEHALMPKAAD
jgi:hypothetical protein